MAIFHDAYLFSASLFASKVEPYLNELQVKEGYEHLRAGAMRLYEDNSDIQNLLSEYGGWDEKSIRSQIPASSPYDEEDTAFWLTVFLYSEFKTEPHQLGVGSGIKHLQLTLKTLGWLDTEISMLIKGNSFNDFAQTWFGQKIGDLNVWKYIRPRSTAAGAGWLSHRDVEHLLLKLNDDKQKLLSLTEGVAEIDSAAAKSAYQSAKAMLVAAQQYNSDLCLIISG
jgi:hypothetical protein